MKRRALTSMLVLTLLAAALSGCGTPSDATGTDSAAGADPYANVRPYAERALALATMQYGLATIATVGNEFEYPPVDFGAFSLERHTVTWLGLLGIEPTPALPPQGTATTLQSGDADGDNAPWAVRSYDLSGADAAGRAFTLTGTAGLGELVGDDDSNLWVAVFDPSAGGTDLQVHVIETEGENSTTWTLGDRTYFAYDASGPLPVEYWPDLTGVVTKDAVEVGRVEVKGMATDGSPAITATLTRILGTTGDYFQIDPVGAILFRVTEGNRAYGPFQLTPVVPASAPLVFDWQCTFSGSRTAGLVSGKVYYLDPSGNTVALVTIQGCGQYEVETFF